MLNISPSDYKFCPICGTRLVLTEEDGKTRKVCPTCGWKYFPQVSLAAVAVIVKGGKALLVKRAREPHRGKWMFPAGFVEFGEHPEETLEREIAEETGLKLNASHLMEVVLVEDDPRNPGVLAFFYRIELFPGTIKNDPQENSEIKWWPLKTPPSIAWKSHKELIRELAVER